MNDPTQTHLLGRLTALGAVLLVTQGAMAMDVTPSNEPVGNHATVATSDGQIRDDELIDHICSEIQAFGGKVKDVKLLANSCFGGGLLDDMARAFGPGGACEGIPWVAGSASSADKSAYGWSDAGVEEFEENFNLGSHWTNALTEKAGANLDNLKGVIRDGSASNNVLTDLQKAANRDLVGPKGKKLETPQFGSGNGGHEVMWHMQGGKHEAVVFGGDQTNQRHHNNIANMDAALKKTWPAGTRTIQAIDGGTTKDLKDAISAAAQRLDENTQLLIYIDDHGGSAIDLSEVAPAIGDILIEDPVMYEVNIPTGWLENWFGMYFARPLEYASPSIDLWIDNCTSCEYWDYMLGGEMFSFPMSGPSDFRSIPLDFYRVRPGNSYFEIVPKLPVSPQKTGASAAQNHAGSLSLNGAQINTGRANELEESVLEVGHSTAYYNPDRDGEGLIVELLADGRMVSYFFSYDRQGDPFWVFGIGKQIGEGVIAQELLRPSGASFGQDFDPEDVNYDQFGFMAFHLPACIGNSQGSLFILPEQATEFEIFNDFSYQRLGRITDCDGTGGAPNHVLSGAWFDPNHDGEGIIIQVQKNGSAAATWFTYDQDGNQLWILGVGTFDGSTLEVDDMYIRSGAKWGPAFDPDDIQTTRWGAMRMIFNGCGSATLQYDSGIGFGAGQLEMQRLTRLEGMDCIE